ncbi:MAG: type II toxin-antitoxin system RelE/ParE family toxin [Bacteroidetes bacterium]|nr:type II toxin-antitoxin system RelE/ParE family toxin [Bacteroidota bacterium]MBU1115376.1 type II toxin-antitoxin system RelE/ParE family toxin [Bacteroidota bacterium]MBU1797897.1 type II toxin-antitoxin system RelE/ParE family toxin [Bacteroidota bacterium]
MAKYRIEIKKSAVKEISKLPVIDLKKILKEIESLTDNPRPFGAIKLSGDDKYRLRVGSYRILYQIFDSKLIVTLVKIGHRKDVYK